MSKQRDREEFVSIMTAEGVPLDVARTLMRYGATLHRLAELACSSEAADRDRVPCPSTGKYVGPRSCLCRDNGSVQHEGPDGHGDVPRIKVHEARTEARAEALCKAHGCGVVFQGDPRGCVFKVTVPSGRTNDGGREGICVPA